MPSLKQDARVVVLGITESELNNLVASKAVELNIIDFQPDETQVDASLDPSGGAWQVTFIKNTV